MVLIKVLRGDSRQVPVPQEKRLKMQDDRRVYHVEEGKQKAGRGPLRRVPRRPKKRGEDKKVA